MFSIGVWKDIQDEEIPDELKVYVSSLPKIVLGSKAKNTYNNYMYNFKQFSNWCNKYGFKSVPAANHHVGIYLSWLMDSNPSVSKVNMAVYSISWAHEIAGLPDPCKSVLVKQIRQGVIRQVSKPVEPKEPLKPEDIKRIVQVYGSGQNLLDLRFVTMCLLGYAGFLRFDELVNIKRNDIFFEDGFIRLFIAKSKTDQFKTGSWLVIAKTGNDTCPVKYLRTYLSAFKVPENSNEFIFRKVTFLKKQDTYVLRKGDHISYTRAREILLENLRKIGLDSSKFGLHSLRSGGASQAANSGLVCDRLFKKHGRWKCDSAKDGYVKEKDEIKRSVSLNLGI